MTTRRVGFARWRSDQPSGGNRYDDELAIGLRALGLDVRDHEVIGPWPFPAPENRARLHELLTAEREWLIDNIVGSAAPDAIEAATGAGRRVTLLMHYFPADEPELSASGRERLAASERQAVLAASALVVTSAWASAEVARRYGRTDAVVAVPGVAPAAPAPGSAVAGGPPTLLWLGRLTGTKDPLTFVEALVAVRDLPWSARLVGPDVVDEPLSRRVRSRLGRAGLAGRVEVTGPRVGAALESIWSGTDLLVHTSRAETYGMVVSEAAARGVPSLVASGTGAAEAQRVGAAFPPGDADALADALRTWLTDAGLRARWRDQASKRRADVATWRDTAAAVARALVA